MMYLDIAVVVGELVGLVSLWRSGSLCCCGKSAEKGRNDN